MRQPILNQQFIVTFYHNTWSASNWQDLMTGAEVLAEIDWITARQLRALAVIEATDKDRNSWRIQRVNK